MNNKELSQLRIDIDELTEQFEHLVDVLRESQVLFSGSHQKEYKYKIFTADIFVRDRYNSLVHRLSKILDHLGLEFEWIECKPHYELKEKE